MAVVLNRRETSWYERTDVSLRFASNCHGGKLALPGPNRFQLVEGSVMAVFVSYSSRDKEAVDHIVGALKAAREQFWLDEELTGGERWWRKILKQIRESDAFIVAVSENSERSKPCHAELEYAIALGLPIIPVQIGALESMMINRVGELQIIDYRQPTPESAIAVSIAVREARERPTELPTPLPQEPPVPFEYLLRLNATLDGSLGPREQEALLAELRRSLNVDGHDEGVRRGIARLLRKLREHHDVTVHIRTEVDALLESISTAPMPRISTFSVQKGSTPDETKASAPHSRWQPSRRVAIAAATVVGVAVIVSILAFAFWPKETQSIPPPGSDECPASNSGTGPFAHWRVDAAHTSCEFGANVAALVTKTLQPRMNNPPSVVVLVGVPSPKTPGRGYDMTCTLDRKLVTCTGGDDAKVYVY